MNSTINTVVYSRHKKAGYLLLILSILVFECLPIIAECLTIGVARRFFVCFFPDVHSAHVLPCLVVLCAVL